MYYYIAWSLFFSNKTEDLWDKYADSEFETVTRTGFRFTNDISIAIQIRWHLWLVSSNLHYDDRYKFRAWHDSFIVVAWTSYQIHNIAGGACAGNAGNVSPPPTSREADSWRSRHASRHVRHARAVMHIEIASPRSRGKRSRHSRCMRNTQFYISGKRPMCRHL